MYMKIKKTIKPFAALVCSVAMALPLAVNVGAAEKDEWTVLLYLCGTDLESNTAAATYNLAEIAKTVPSDNVNFVIQTGGTKHWMTKEYIAETELDRKLNALVSILDEVGFKGEKVESAKKLITAMIYMLPQEEGAEEIYNSYLANKEIIEGTDYTSVFGDKAMSVLAIGSSVGLEEYAAKYMLYTLYCIYNDIPGPRLEENLAEEAPAVAPETEEPDVAEKESVVYDSGYFEKIKQLYGMNKPDESKYFGKRAVFAFNTDETAAKKLANIDPDPAKIQRYEYNKDGFKLVDSGALTDMAQSETLSDFIKYGVKNYPAQKYMLVMWDHGGGTAGGLICDELYGHAGMSIDNIADAISAANIKLDVFVSDACLMSTVEFEQALADNVDYIIASEEIVPGTGTAYTSWLQYLYDKPTCTCVEFGKHFCASTFDKYKENNDERFVTYSLLSTSSNDELTKAFNALFAALHKTLDDPEAFHDISYYTRRSECYYESTQVDLYDFAKNVEKSGYCVEEARALMAAIEKTVVYETHGGGRINSHGITFYYPVERNTPNIDGLLRFDENYDYIAFIDAIRSDWEAPSEVYEKIGWRKTDYKPTYSYDTDVVVENGEIKLKINSGDLAIDSINGEVNALFEEGKVELGVDTAIEDNGTNEVIARFDGKWPMLNGEFCSMSLKSETIEKAMFSIPVYIPDPLFFNEEMHSVYASLDYYDPEGNDAINEGEYSVVGIWDLEELYNSEMPSRDYISLDSVKDRDIYIVHYVTTPTDKEKQKQVGSKLDPGKLQITRETLPEGLYSYSFRITDVFGKSTTTDPVLIYWDGKTSKVVK